jgi:hypothetical protein
MFGIINQTDFVTILMPWHLCGKLPLDAKGIPCC